MRLGGEGDLNGAKPVYNSLDVGTGRGPDVELCKMAVMLPHKSSHCPHNMLLIFEWRSASPLRLLECLQERDPLTHVGCNYF